MFPPDSKISGQGFPIRCPEKTTWKPFPNFLRAAPHAIIWALRKKGNFWDLVFLTRPMLMVAGWVFMTMGYFWGKGLPFLGFSVPLDARFWLAFASYSLEMGVVYVINQIRDIESDRANRKLLILPDGLISVRGAWWWTGILFVASAALSVLAGWQFLVIWAISGVFGFLYSGPPNLKGLPIPNITMNMLGYGAVAFAAGWVVGGPPRLDFLIHTLPYIFGCGAVTAGTIIPDIPGDARAGEKTIGVRYGARWTAWFAFACDIIALLTGLLARDWIISAAALFSAPFFLVAAIRVSDFAVKFAYRVASFTLALFVGVRFPVFALLAALSWAGARAYYWLRFGIKDYPSFTGK